MGPAGWDRAVGRVPAWADADAGLSGFFEPGPPLDAGGYSGPGRGGVRPVEHHAQWEQPAGDHPTRQWPTLPPPAQPSPQPPAAPEPVPSPWNLLAAGAVPAGQERVDPLWWVPVPSPDRSAPWAGLPVAERLFLALHDDITGRTHAGPAALGLALAGGLLAELLIDGRITLSGGLVRPVTGRPPAEAVAARLLATICREPAPLPVATWLAFISRHATDEVARRLHHGGWLVRTERGGLLGRRVRVEFPDRTRVAMVGVGLRERVRRTDVEDLTDAAAIGLIDAAGLVKTVLWEDPGTWLAALAGRAPPDLLALLEHVRIAVADAVVNHRH